MHGIERDMGSVLVVRCILVNVGYDSQLQLTLNTKLSAGDRKKNHRNKETVLPASFSQFLPAETCWFKPVSPSQFKPVRQKSNNPVDGSSSGNRGYHLSRLLRRQIPETARARFLSRSAHKLICYITKL